MIEGRKVTWFARLGIVAVSLVFVLAACDLSGDDAGLSDGAGTEVTDMGIVWNGDEFELTGTVTELDPQPTALTVTYPTAEGAEESILVIVPDSMLFPELNRGDLVVIRGERDASGALIAHDIERTPPRGAVPDN